MKTLRIGTRPSPLAMVQAIRVEALFAALGLELDLSIVPISSKGDQDQRSSLQEIGGKGVFIRELEQALLDDRIDVAVHSFKDVTTQLLEGLSLTGFLAPDSQRDVLVARDGLSFFGLSEGAVIGSGSARRQAWVRRFRPELDVVDIRGNVETRIGLVDSGKVDAVLLSEAGLMRLGLEERITHRFEVEEFIPAPGQGVIALESRDDDEDVASLCQRISDPDQLLISRAECLFLEQVGFDCRDPLGVVTKLSGEQMRMKGLMSCPDYRHYLRHQSEFDVSHMVEGVQEFASVFKQW